MTLSSGQALAGAHIPTLAPLRETAKLCLGSALLRLRGGTIRLP